MSEPKTNTDLERRIKEVEGYLKREIEDTRKYYIWKITTVGSYHHRKIFRKLGKIITGHYDFTQEELVSETENFRRDY